MKFISFVNIVQKTNIYGASNREEALGGMDWMGQVNHQDWGLEPDDTFFFSVSKYGWVIIVLQRAKVAFKVHLLGV